MLNGIWLESSITYQKISEETYLTKVLHYGFSFESNLSKWKVWKVVVWNNLLNRALLHLKILENCYEFCFRWWRRGAEDWQTKTNFLSNFQEFLDSEELCRASYFRLFTLIDVIQNWTMKNFCQKCFLWNVLVSYVIGKSILTTSSWWHKIWTLYFYRMWSTKQSL